MDVIRTAAIPFHLQPYFDFEWVPEQAGLRDPASE